jgi:hypothetical protein
MKDITMSYDDAAFDEDLHEPAFGPYISLETFREYVVAGALGPDEACYWVYITEDGYLAEVPIKHPKEALSFSPIAVAYYAA